MDPIRTTRPGTAVQIFGIQARTSSLEILSFLLLKKWAGPKSTELVAASSSANQVPIYGY